MSIGGSSYNQQVNASEAERARKLARSVDLDLNNPPPSEIVALAGPSGVQSQQHSSDSPDDECLIISPGKFEEVCYFIINPKIIYVNAWKLTVLRIF